MEKESVKKMSSSQQFAVGSVVVALVVANVSLFVVVKKMRCRQLMCGLGATMNLLGTACVEKLKCGPGTTLVGTACQAT